MLREWVVKKALNMVGVKMARQSKFWGSFVITMISRY